MTTNDRSFFGHPRGLSTLFFTEMWERFSFYGMRGILALFLVAAVSDGGMGLSKEEAGAIGGTYAASVYMMTLVGGWFADKLLGLHRSVFWGGVLIMFGQISLAIPGAATFYLGLLLLIFGTGLLKGNISVMVGKLYSSEDTRRDAGFSLYYMGINLGAFIGPIVTGWLAEQPAFRGVLDNMGISPQMAWHFGFAAGAVGMFLGLVQYTFGRKHLPSDIDRPPGVNSPEEAAKARRQLKIGAMVVAVLVAVIAALHSTGTVTITILGVAAVMDAVLLIAAIGFFVWLFTMGQWTGAERKRLIAILVLFLGAAAFWAGFEQAATTLNFFAKEKTSNTFLGMNYPAAWWQSVNSVFILLLAPIIGAIWLKLGNKNPSSPAKFSLGLFFLSLSYVWMIAASVEASKGNKVGAMWLLGCYFLQTIGELCLSPVGLSAMSSLAPARVQGMMMGVWFLAASVGNKVAGRVGGLFDTLELPSLFSANAAFAMLFAVILALLIKPIKKMLSQST